MPRSAVPIGRRSMLALSAAAPAAAGLSTVVTSSTPAKGGGASPARIHFRTQTVGDVEVFYREAGPADAPVLLLLHGFPTSGHMYRDLIPHLADAYRVIAPDLPGFGETTAPSRERFTYGFASLATTMEGFVDALGLDRYAIYIFDYGAPVGLRLALAQQERVSAIISQNGNAYVEGLSQGWSPIQRYWSQPTKENREALRIFQSPDAVRQQYVAGVPDPSLVSTDGSNLDSFFLARPGRDEIQLDLILDYRSNVELYPQFHAYFRARQPPLLAAWGRNDPFFLPAGADAFKRDIPSAEIHFFDTGHFALETHHQEIAALMRDFLGRQKL